MDNRRPNFNPLLRLVFGKKDIEPADRVTFSQWNKALQAMDAHYSQQPKDFNHNPEGKLIELLRSNGGVAGLAEAIPGVADQPAPDSARSSKTKGGAGSSDARVTAEMSRQALAQVNDFAKIAAFTTQHLIRVGADGLLVLLARRDQTGRITILGSSNDPAQIEAVAASIARRDFANVTPSLGALVQIVATQVFSFPCITVVEREKGEVVSHEVCRPGRSARKSSRRMGRRRARPAFDQLEAAPPARRPRSGP
jgi:hypothetical protein